MNTISVDENTYTQIFVDVTKKCNMNCAVCYQGDKKTDNEFLDVDYFEEVCKRLPKRVVFRFTGGEPTLHPELPKILSLSQQYGNVTTLVSNGKRLTDLDYVKELKKACPTLMAGVTIDGGLHNREVYKLISSEDIMDKKLKALYNLLEADLRKVSAGAIIIKGLNESVIDDLFYLAKCHKKLKYLYVRPLAPVGYFIDYESYDVHEMFELVKTKMPGPITRIIKRHPDCCGGCIAFIVDNKYQVGITDLGSCMSIACVYRGKLQKDFTVGPFFEDTVTPN